MRRSYSIGVGWGAKKLLTITTGFVTKHEHLPRTWSDTLARTKQRKGDMRLRTWNVSRP